MELSGDETSDAAAQLTRKNNRRKKKSTEAGLSRPGLNARQCAQRLLSAIVDARTPMDALTDDAHGHPTYLALERRDRSLVRAILMAALRYRGDLEAFIDRFVERPLPEGAHSLRAILHVASAQILFLDVPAHSAVDLAVECANRDPRNRRFAALINAITRRMVREKGSLLSAVQRGQNNAPSWFFDRMVEVYGIKAAENITAMHRHPAPTDITLRTGDIDVANRLMAAAKGKKLDATSVRLVGKLNVTDLPGFDDGSWWVQDYAASIPAKLFGDLKNKRVLDLCAAPGGKTAQLLAMGASVTALEKSANRAKRLRENLARTNLSETCEVIVEDLFKFQSSVPYDAVLLDAPCSSTGTVRRHPDVPWTKTPDDIAKLASLQARMLQKAKDFVGPGGLLVFSNCSLDPLEGEEVARAFQKENDGAFDSEVMDVSEDVVTSDMITEEGWVRTTPDHMVDDEPLMAGMDGFFAARFRRR
ncbi:MAG: transcription antitermination factor NusB [Pseudomonadota bacterium]